MNQGFTIPGHALIIFGMAAIVEQPGKRPFDDPTPGQDGKTGAFFFDDFQVDFVTLLQGGDPCFEDVAAIAAIDPPLFQAFDAGDKVGAQHAHQAVSIGSIGRGDQHPDDHPQGVDQGMPLAAIDSFSGIVTLCLGLGCRLNTLTIHTPGRRVGLAALACAFVLGQRLHHLLPDAGPAPGVKVAIDGLPATEAGRQHTPLTAGLGHLESPVDDPTSRTGRSTRSPSAPLRRGQQGLKDLPLRVGQIGRIFILRTHDRPFALGFFVEPKGGLVSTFFLSPFYLFEGFKIAS